MKNIYRVIFQNAVPLRVLASSMVSAVEAAQKKLNITSEPVSVNSEGAVDIEAA